MDKKKLIIVGDSAFAEIAYEYFTFDSDYDVVAFAVEKEYLKKNSLFDLPIVAFESLEEVYPPTQYVVFVAITYIGKNSVRTRLYQTAKEKGYTLASYVSKNAFVWRNVKLGEHCFIFENNVIQPFSNIGNNVILWSGNHIGHHSKIGDNCFISSHVVISGFVTIGQNCFMGVNSTIFNNITVGDKCIIGAGALISSDLPSRQMVKGLSSN